MRSYASSIIYKLCSNDASITDIYIGSTTNFVKRKQKHKHSCYTTNTNKRNLNVYQFIRANGGWESWNMVEIERYNAIDKRNLLTRERYWLENLKATLNSYVPTRTKKEYYIDNKTEILEKCKQYHIENIEHRKQYRIDNKDEILEKDKQYRIDNKDELAKRQRQYYSNNKTEILEKSKQTIACVCGIIIDKSHSARHMKTKKYDFAHNLHIFIHS